MAKKSTTFVIGPAGGSSSASGGAAEPRPTILDEAKELVYGPRAAVYGHPADNFKTIARMWTAFLQHRLLREGVNPDVFEFTPEDVAMFMVLVKVARLANTPGHAETAVDIAGYVATMERVWKGV